MRRAILLGLLALVIALLGLAANIYGHVDNYPALHTYGMSVGSDTTYASFDVVNGHPALSYQSGN